MTTNICFRSALSARSVFLITPPPPPLLHLSLLLAPSQRYSSHLPFHLSVFVTVFRRGKTRGPFSLHRWCNIFLLLRLLFPDRPVSPSSGPRTSDSRKGEVCSRAPADEEAGGRGSGAEAHGYRRSDARSLLNCESCRKGATDGSE